MPPTLDEGDEDESDGSDSEEQQVAVPGARSSVSSLARSSVSSLAADDSAVEAAASYRSRFHTVDPDVSVVKINVFKKSLVEQVIAMALRQVNQFNLSSRRNSHSLDLRLRRLNRALRLSRADTLTQACSGGSARTPRAPPLRGLSRVACGGCGLSLTRRL